MSERGRRNSEGSELKMHLPPSPSTCSCNSSSAESPDFSASEMTATSEDSSCVSSAAQETRAMPLVGCPRCLMYVMLSEVDPKCPNCNSTVFLYFLSEENTDKPEN